jgi:hypothetical protein
MVAKLSSISSVARGPWCALRMAAAPWLRVEPGSLPDQLDLPHGPVYLHFPILWCHSMLQEQVTDVFENVFETINSGFAQALYEDYLRDPSSVPEEWRELFDNGLKGAQPIAGPTVADVEADKVSATGEWHRACFPPRCLSSGGVRHGRANRGSCPPSA